MPSPNRGCFQRGFSLVELSIVLVILGLLTGGILAGQSLIRASELRSVSTDLARYSTAIMAFRDKYFALPGDMTNAQSFWGVQHATPATCKTTASTSALTCNGDGNGQISFGAVGSNEGFRAWQHMANAGLVEGSYSGVKKAGGTDERETEIGVNIPRGRLDNAGYCFRFTVQQTGADPNWYVGDYGNSIIVGKEFANFENWTAFAKPEEAWNIDTKLDDGLPPTGIVRTTTPTWAPTANCATNGTMSATYKLTDSSKACSIMYLLKV